MKKLLFTLTLLGTMQLTQAQSINDLLNKGKQILNGNTPTGQQGSNNGIGGNLGNNEIVNGLKEALRVGTQNAA